MVPATQARYSATFERLRAAALEILPPTGQDMSFADWRSAIEQARKEDSWETLQAARSLVNDAIVFTTSDGSRVRRRGA